MSKLVLIACQAMSLAVLFSVSTGCAVNRREIRQQERVEHRVEERIERRHGEDDD